MQSESSWKYYYRYKVLSLADIQLPVIHRRIKKAHKNNATHILIDWTEANLELKTSSQGFLNSLFTGQIESLITFSQLSSHIEQLNQTSHDIHVITISSQEIINLDRLLLEGNFKPKVHIHLSPTTGPELESFAEDIVLAYPNYGSFFWNFKSYNPELKNSLTLKNIGLFFENQKLIPFLKFFPEGKLQGLEIWNEQIPEHYELEADHFEEWNFFTVANQVRISLIIPTYNNVKFLGNVITHLLKQTIKPEDYEIIIVDDGGTDHSSETIQLLFQNYHERVNLKYIYWSKNHPNRGAQNFFRAGLARNLGVSRSQGEHILFLDSDILVPPEFIQTAIEELQTNSVIQFQRYHIKQELSLKNPAYSEVNIDQDTYIEERDYWIKLFNCQHWSHLPQYWKYTCTYALGLRKELFFRCGRFKKYYVSYGFEDTDLGYELYKRHSRFKLVKMGLLHLTAYDKLQYKNSQTKRYKLLKKTAALFYRQHLDSEIINTLSGYFHFEKPVLRMLKDLF